MVFAVDDINVVAVSKVLGYTSIACWLCAQFPQVLKNAQRKSCEGLALPFLVNWLFGDVTNLIGCILTDQLPFQTYLAAYFCLVDFTLLSQFFYYRTPTTTHTPRHIAYTYPSPHASLVLPPPIAPRRSNTSTTHPSPVVAAPAYALSKPVSGRGRRRPPLSTTTSTTYSQPPDIAVQGGSYEAIYAAALDVARAAERVSSRRSHSGRRRASRHTTAPPPAASSFAANAASDGADDQVPSSMMDSFHSEMSLESSTDEDEAGTRRLSQSTGTVLDSRGRSMVRTLHGGDGHGEPIGERGDTIEGLPHTGSAGMLEVPRSKSRSQSLARARGSGRRAAGVAFMSLGLLLGWGSWPRNAGLYSSVNGHVVPASIAVASSSTSVSAVWPPRHPIPLSHSLTPNMFDNSPLPFRFSTLPPSQSQHDSPSPSTVLEDPPPQHAPHPPHEDISFQRVIGRVSAWCCTTLYLTSRLPQIWKNFERKSVEGLSILLFVFAFCGNLTYVFSILLNPSGTGDQSEAAHYLLEALPYLLGSGGTLVFDLTIMVQSLMYGSAPPVAVSTPHDRAARRLHGFPRRRLHHPEDGTPTPVSSERRPLLSGAVSPDRVLATSGGGRRSVSRQPSRGASVVDGLGVRLSDDGPPLSPVKG